MNHAYRLVWNQTVNAWVAVPETAKAHGKGSKLKAAALAIVSLVALNAYGLPVGGQVSAGSGTISQAGSTMTVSRAARASPSTGIHSTSLRPRRSTSFNRTSRPSRSTV